jgi:hypothetical protein
MIPLWKGWKRRICVGRQKRPMFFSKKRRGVIRILSGREYVCSGVLSFAYIRIAVGDPVIKRGGLGSH